MLCDILPGDDGLAAGALDSDHLTGLLVLDDVAPCAFHFAVGCCIARHPFHLLAVHLIVLYDVFLQELPVAEQALQSEVTAFYWCIVLAVLAGVLT